jgi:hypothetical protein
MRPARLHGLAGERPAATQTAQTAVVGQWVCDRNCVIANPLPL